MEDIEVKSYFKDFIEFNVVNKLDDIVNIVTAIVLIVSLFIFFISFDVFSQFPFADVIERITSQEIFYVIICFAILLDRSKLRERFSWLINLCTGIILFFGILTILSYFHIAGINNWMHVSCEFPLFGVYNMLSYVYLLYFTIRKRYIKSVQILALINLSVGYGGLLFYCNSIFSNNFHIIHYLLYHLLLSAIFLFYYPTKGILRVFFLNTVGSRLSRKIIYLSSIFISVICFLFVVLESSYYIGSYVSIILISIASLVFIMVLMFLSGFKLTSLDIKNVIYEKNTLKLQKSLEEIQDLSKVAILNKNNDGYIWTSEIWTILEIDEFSGIIHDDLIYDYSIPEYQSKMREYFKTLSEDNLKLNFITEIKTGKGNLKYLKVIANYNDLRDHNFTGFVQDITDRVLIQEELENSLENQTILLKEVHHRVKNNLQIILSLLNLELRFNRDDPENIIKQIRNRINAMALTHEQVYQSSDVAHVNVNEYINESMNNLFKVYASQNISKNFDIDDVEIHMDKSIPLGLILNELALNTIKYAFPNNEKGNFNLEVKKIDDLINIKVYDDGVGVPDDFTFENRSSLGFTIISNLIVQLDANFTRLNNIDGFGVEISFKVD